METAKAVKRKLWETEEEIENDQEREYRFQRIRNYDFEFVSSQRHYSDILLYFQNDEVADTTLTEPPMKRAAYAPLSTRLLLKRRRAPARYAEEEQRDLSGIDLSFRGLTEDDKEDIRRDREDIDPSLYKKPEEYSPVESPKEGTSSEQGSEPIAEENDEEI